jgi:hypothetical protein
LYRITFKNEEDIIFTFDDVMIRSEITQLQTLWNIARQCSVTLHDRFHISPGIIPIPPYISPRPSRRLIWVEGWYGKGHVLIFLSYTSDRLFYEANKKKWNNYMTYIIWKFNCVFNRYIFRTLLSNKSISTPININGNMSYESIWKQKI